MRIRQWIRQRNKRNWLYFLGFGLLLISACQPSLERQPKIGILEEPRVYVPGTVPYSTETLNSPKITRALIARGRDRYQIYCGVCHGLTGAGDGMATQRGFGAPKAFDFAHENISMLERTIANGKGRMIGFANRIPYADRYAIAAYTEVLNLRAHFPSSELNARDLLHFQEGAK